MPSIQRSEQSKAETFGEVFVSCCRHERLRRLAKLFAMGILTTDRKLQADIADEIRRMLGMDAKESNE